MKYAFRLALFFIAVGYSAGAAAQGDVDVRLSLAGDRNSFHQGEPIGFDLSFTSEADGKYLISPGGLIRDFTDIEVRLAPLEGVRDARSFGRCWGGTGGSLLTGGPQYLSSKPITEHGELTDWYRFQTPGHYTVSVVSRGVLRPKGVDEGGGYETLTLQSNLAEFDILPPDPVWESDQLRAISRQLEDTKNPGERMRIAGRLASLDTPESARKLVELYLAGSEDKYSYGRSLAESSQIDVVLPLLEAALSNPDINPSGLPSLLAELQVRKQLGVLPAFPQDSSAQQEWQAECRSQQKLYGELLSRNNSLLLSNISMRSGPPQSASIYEAWTNAENAKSQGEQDPKAMENLAGLRASVLRVAADLDPSQRGLFLTSEWNILPHEELKPIVLSLASEQSVEGYHFWCEDWPGECSKAILSDALNPDARLTPPDILEMPEGNHPEIDTQLREELAKPELLQSPARGQRIAAVVLRAGTVGLLPAVDETLSELAAKKGYTCEIEAYLLGYLLRVAAEDGSRRFAEFLQADKCGDQLFRILNGARYSDALIPIAVRGLDSPNPGTEAMAALFLAEHGPAEEEDAIWEHLNAFWLKWHDRSGELQRRFSFLEHDPAQQSALLEQALASALAHANNWKLTPAEQTRLRNGCITEPCRDIADGKMSLGL
jgi:hypothetical protein